MKFELGKLGMGIHSRYQNAVSVSICQGLWLHLFVLYSERGLVDSVSESRLANLLVGLIVALYYDHKCAPTFEGSEKRRCAYSYIILSTLMHAESATPNRICGAGS